jgi:hypothetical protein
MRKVSVVEVKIMEKTMSIPAFNKISRTSDFFLLSTRF